MTKQLSRKRQPDLLLRLGFLILIQVVFAFGALALFIKNFNDDNARDEMMQATERMRQIALELDQAELVDRFTIREESGPMTQATPEVDSFFSAQSALDAASVFVAGGDDSPEAVFWWSRRVSTESSGSISLNELIEPNSLSCALDQVPGTVVPRRLIRGKAVYYYPFEIGGGKPATLVAVTDDSFLVSTESRMWYGVLVLFLCSFLVSLLTVYLVYRYVREPLKRLRLGLQKTTEGDLFYQIEPTGKGEVTEIARSFNQISERLWRNHKRLKQYNSLMQDAYLSNLESQAFLATLIDSSPCCIVATSPSGEIMIFNRKASEAFGYGEELPLGCHVDELFMRPVQPGHSDSGEAETAGHEVVCKRKDGDQFPAYLVATPILNGEGQILAMLYLLLDISESKSFQDMMVRVDRHRTRGEMAGDIAHEINNYLAVLSGNVELMPLFLKKGDPDKITSKLELMKKTVDRISHFTDGLMDVNHGEAEFERVDLNQLIQNLLTFLKPQNRFDGIVFETKLGSELPLCEADPGQIQQLLVNFIHNAGDALADSESKHISLVTAPTTIGDLQAVRIEVRDSGPGVPEEKRPALFAKRFTTKRKGHGYGLVTCRRIAEAHRGRVGYQFEDDSVFFLELPVIHEAQPEEAGSEAPPAETAATT